MKKLLLIICIITLSKTTKSQVDSALAAQLQDVLNNRVTTGGDHGVSAHMILQNGSTWSGTAGVNGQNLLITDSTVFIAASISKLNIATLMLLFAEDGIVNLDSSWHTYVPNLNVAFDTTITLRQLLNHTSGIADFLEVPANYHYITDDFNHFYTPQYTLENIVSGVPDFVAGTNFNYSNSNYLFAAYIAEAVTPNSLAYELRTRIWAPLGMNHTHLGAYEPISEQRAGVWWNFNSGLTDYSSQPDSSMLSFGFGTDNVVTCPTDLAKLVHGIMNDQILSAQSKAEMLTFVPESFVNQWAAGYGLGIHHLLGQNVDQVIGHNGKFYNNSDAFHSEMCGFTIAVMSNTETLWQGIINPLYDVARNYFQCNSVPVANFYSTNKIGCPGTIITFIDSSTNVTPTAWLWDCPGGSFTGGTTANDSMPQVIYNTPGVYAVSCTVSTSAGSDSITKNSYITINSNSIDHNSAFFEDFETTTLPNIDWSINNDENVNWEITSSAATSGTQSIYINNSINAGGNKSRIISSTFDLTAFTSPKLSFKMAYRQDTASNNDKLQVLTSTNCGSSWVTRLSKQGSTLTTVSPPDTSFFIPTGAQFMTYTVNLTAVASSNNVRFKFEFTADPSGPGNNIYIDDINIFDGSVGIAENDSQVDLNVFPNPSNEIINFDFSLNEKHNISVTITDLLGRIIEFRPAKAYPKGQSLISINDSKTYGEGIYFVNLNIDGKIITRKIIIK